MGMVNHVGVVMLTELVTIKVAAPGGMIESGARLIFRSAEGRVMVNTTVEVNDPIGWMFTANVVASPGRIARADGTAFSVKP